jgi:hypothetical protein
MDFPVISFTKQAKRHLRAKGATVYLRRHPKAGQSGYSPDTLIASTDLPGGYPECLNTIQDGITVYFDQDLSIDKFDQIDIWTITKYWFLPVLKARITLYKRFIFDEQTAASSGTSA